MKFFQTHSWTRLNDSFIAPVLSLFSNIFYLYKFSNSYNILFVYCEMVEELFLESAALFLLLNILSLNFPIFEC